MAKKCYECAEQSTRSAKTFWDLPERTMPDFDLLPLDEAIDKLVSNTRSGPVAEYLGYINSLKPGQAGRLRIRAGEKLGLVRMQLGTAARMAGKQVVIRRSGDEIIFWVNETQRGDSLLVRRAPSGSRRVH
jgi:hypothetical protein